MMENEILNVLKSLDKNIPFDFLDVKKLIPTAELTDIDNILEKLERYNIIKDVSEKATINGKKYVISSPLV